MSVLNDRGLHFQWTTLAYTVSGKYHRDDLTVTVYRGKIKTVAMSR